MTLTSMATVTYSRTAAFSETKLPERRFPQTISRKGLETHSAAKEVVWEYLWWVMLAIPQCSFKTVRFWRTKHRGEGV